jgi:FAD-dependent urate hydroxylase
LFDGAGHDTVTLNKQVVDYETTDEGIQIKFADGSTESGDFLVIADGTHSKLRNKVCGETVERKYVGYINFNAAVPQSIVNVSIFKHRM